MGRRLRRLVLFGLIRFLMLIARAFPRSVMLGLFGGLGAASFVILRRDRIRTEVNLSLAFPQRSRQDIRALARRVYVDLGRNCVDVFRLGALKWQDLRTFVRVENVACFDEALSRGKGVIAVTGHIGCWELLGAHFSMLGYPLAVIARPLRDPRLELLIDGLRRSKGMKPISRMSNVKTAYSWLKDGGVLGVLIDQDTSVKGVFCDFFGRKAFTPAGPAYLALRTGAAIVPMAIQMEEDGTQVVRVKSPIAIPEVSDTETCVKKVMQECTNAIEDYVRQRPTQWVWMHDRWKTSPGQETAETSDVGDRPPEQQGLVERR